jgi:outer membrane lipoprotein SlyB
LAGCQNNTENGALIGGATGAGIGAIIGHNSHGQTAAGAAIGGAVGAVTGALVGNQIDQQQAQQQATDAYYHSNGYRQYQSPYDQNARPINQQDVIAMSARGDPDDVIIDRIDRSPSVFHLTAADENKLRDAGVSDEVIGAMRQKG